VFWEVPVRFRKFPGVLEKLSVWGALPQDWGAFRPAGAFFSKSAPENAHFACVMGLCAGWRPKVWDKGARLPDGCVVCDRFESLGRPSPRLGRVPPRNLYYCMHAHK